MEKKKSRNAVWISSLEIFLSTSPIYLRTFLSFQYT